MFRKFGFGRIKKIENSQVDKEHNLLDNQLINIDNTTNNEDSDVVCSKQDEITG